ncbi:histidine kinase [Streptomyces sp. 150FB]|uniref:sensor histidine kinase n=1 Tax=Streptomyces sp. 150FB TaxID=1576605 RepID=UPI001364ABA2|nr:histidine kinase [Streptomyces sp. 150FB]
MVAFLLPHDRRGGWSLLVAVPLVVWGVLACARDLLSRRTLLLGWGLVLVLSAVGTGAAVDGASIVAGVAVFIILGMAPPTVWLVPTLALGVAGFFVAYFLGWSDSPGADLFFAGFTGAVGGGFGLLTRRSALDRQAERRVTEQRAENAVFEERARISRDIHDVLAHSLGGLVLQLDALEAVTLARQADTDVVERVRGARALAANGLEDAKRAVDALRGFPGRVDTALDRIVAESRALGMEVDAESLGAPERVPAAVADVVASITVETLTNARKHAPGAPVSVRLEAGRTSVLLRVSNPRTGPRTGGPPAPRAPASGGHGIRGMRERAEIVGGRLHIGDGARDDGAGDPASAAVAEAAGTWTVECEIPYV